MKKIMTFLLFTFCVTSFIAAQEESDKFRLELSTQSLFANYDVLRSSDYTGLNIAKRVPNFTVQISAFWALGDRLELGAGLAYANRDAYTTCYCAFCDKFFPTEDFTRIRSLELPLEVRWKWLKEAKRFDPYVSLGANNRVPFGSLQVFSSEGGGLKFSRLSSGLILGLGSRIHLYEKWSLLVAASVGNYIQFNKEDDFFIPISGVDKVVDEWSVKFGFCRSF